MNTFIEKINFKIVAIIYLILLIITTSMFVLLFSNIYKDKIKLLYNYHKLNEALEKESDYDKIKIKINNLSKSSKDIIDIAVINNNAIEYTINNLYKNNLTNINNTNNYYVDDNNNIYKLDTKKDFILEIFGIKKENNNDYYNNFKINDSEIKYTINYLKDNHTNDKIIILTKIDNIKDSEKYIKIIISVITFFIMLYWVLITLMVYQNALRLNINAYFWAFITIITNIFGVIAYIIYIKNITVCKKCKTKISIRDNFCKGCG